MSTYVAVARRVEAHWVVDIDGVGASAGASLAEALAAAQYLLHSRALEDGDEAVHLSSFVVEDGILRVHERSQRRRPSRIAPWS